MIYEKMATWTIRIGLWGLAVSFGIGCFFAIESDHRIRKEKTMLTGIVKPNGEVVSLSSIENVTLRDSAERCFEAGFLQGVNENDALIENIIADQQPAADQQLAADQQSAADQQPADDSPVDGQADKKSETPKSESGI